MSFGVFLHRDDSVYDDDPAARYQFPRLYLSRARQCVGDWIIYYEPRRGGGRGYYAIARLQAIVDDPTTAGMHVALMEPGSYLEFERPVPFSDADGLVEQGLLNPAGVISGRAQAAMRPISAQDFARIIGRGFADDQPLLPRIDGPATASAVREERAVFAFDAERERITYLTSRPVRDRIFRRIVLDAYDSRCALTGLKLINGGGRAEAEAAHIKPVEHAGPDRVANGIALSGTVHWMFDRGLIALQDDLGIVVSRQANDAASIWAMLNPDRRARAPRLAEHHPHPAFLRWHRERCFKA